jgi:hypothetical protein
MHPSKPSLSNRKEKYNKGKVEKLGKIWATMRGG